MKGDSEKDAAAVVQFVFDSQMSKPVESLAAAAALIDNSGSCLIFFNEGVLIIKLTLIHS